MGFGSISPQVSMAAATMVIFISMAIPLWPRHWSLRLQIPVRIGVFAVLTILMQKILVSPLAPQFDVHHPATQIWQEFIEAGWFMVAAKAAVAIGRLAVVLENRPRETRIVSDLIAGAIYVATILAIINFAFQVPIRGVLATSGVLAIVLGLALQSTLSDVFSGIAVGLERPYKPGDLIWVEGNIEGRVVQLNWRSTQIATGHDNIAIVPNSVMAKARIINRSAPSPVRGDTITVQLDPTAYPEMCLATMQAAILACGRVLEQPAATVRLSNLKGDGAVYDLSFSVESSETLSAAREELLSQLHRHLRHSGIALAVTGLPPASPPAIPTSRELLEQSNLFAGMDELDRDLLAQHLRAKWLIENDTLQREGESSGSMFMVARGTAEITQLNGGKPERLHRLGPGDSFGMVALVTGMPSTVTVRALTALKVFELDKADISAALKIRPELSAGLETLAHNAQAILSRFATKHEQEHLLEPEIFLHRLKSFLRTIVH